MSVFLTVIEISYSSPLPVQHGTCLRKLYGVRGKRVNISCEYLGLFIRNFTITAHIGVIVD